MEPVLSKVEGSLHKINEALKSKSCLRSEVTSSFTLAKWNMIFRNLFASLDLLVLFYQEKSTKRNNYKLIIIIC